MSFGEILEVDPEYFGVEINQTSQMCGLSSQTRAGVNTPTGVDSMASGLITIISPLCFD